MTRSNHSPNHLFFRQLAAVEDVKSLVELFENISGGLGELIADNCGNILENDPDITFAGWMSLLDRRLKWIEKNLKIDLVSFFKFFDSEEYWNLEFKSPDDLLKNVYRVFPDPGYYPARHFLDYVLFPSYYFRKKWILDRWGTNFSSILDAGCGSGEILYEIVSRFKGDRLEIHAVDWLGVSLDFSRLFVNHLLEGEGKTDVDITWEINDLGSMDCKQRRYDAVICTEVLEHLVSPTETFSKLAGALKPGGRIFVSFPLRDPGHEHLQDFRDPAFIRQEKRVRMVEEEWVAFEDAARGPGCRSIPSSRQHYLAVLTAAA